MFGKAQKVRGIRQYRICTCYNLGVYNDLEIKKIPVKATTARPTASLEMD